MYTRDLDQPHDLHFRYVICDLEIVPKCLVGDWILYATRIW